MSDITEMVRELRDLKDRKAALDEELKEVNGAIRRLAENEIPTYFEDNEIEKLTVEGAGTVYIQTKVYANCKAENREAFFEWLRGTGNADLIKETVHPSTLNAFAKEYLNDGKELPDSLDARLYPTAMLRRN